MPVSEVVGRLVASCRSKAGVASVPPKEIVTPPSETELFTNLPFAILPASWSLVIVPVSEVVGRPVASCRLKAGVASVPPNDKVTPPKLTVLFTNLPFTILPASWSLVIVPVSEVVGRLVASCKSKAGVASVPPNETETPPSETELFTNLPFTIFPASWSFVIVPVSEDVG